MATRRKRGEGWGKPPAANAVKRHYFAEGKSLCGNYFWQQSREMLLEQREANFPTDCALCQAAYAKRASRTPGSGAKRAAKRTAAKKSPAKRKDRS